MPDIADIIEKGGKVKIVNETTGEEIFAECDLTERTRDIILAGGLLNYTKLNG